MVFEGEFKPDWLSKLRENTDFYKAFSNGISRGIQNNVDRLVTDAFEETGAKYLSLKEMTQGIQARWKYDIHPEKLMDWIFIYQEKTGKDLIQAVPETFPVRYERVDG